MRVFKQIGKAVCYTLLFLGMQVIASFLFTIVYSVMNTMEQIAQNGAAGLDQAAMEEQLMEEVLGQTNVILLISNLLVLVFLLIFFAIRRKKPLREVQAVRFSAGYIPHIAVLAVAMSLMVCVGLGFLPEDLMESYSSASQYVVSDNTLLTILSVVIIGPITEEIIFRGLVYSRLKKVMPMAVAVVLASLTFGLMHGQSVWIVYAFLLGIILNLVVIKTGSLWCSILLHVLFNLMGGLVIPAIVPEGWSDGVYAVIAAAAAVVVIAELIVLVKKSAAKGSEE